MGIWQKIKSKVKKWFGGSGGGSTKRKKKEPPQPRAVSNNRDARNQTVSSRTGTGSTFNKRELVNSLKAQKKEEDRVKEAFKAKTTEYKSLADASKSDRTEKRKELESTLNADKNKLKEIQDYARKNPQQKKNTATLDPKTEAAKKSRAEMRKKLDAKKQENKEWHEVTNNRFNVGEKGISDEERKRRQQNVKSQTYDEKTAVKEAEHQMKWHGKEMSFARGALSGATFGASDLAAKKLTKGEARKAEEVYQQNKSKGWETAGEIAGSLASFGATAGATEKAAAKLTSKVAPKAAEKLAERQIIKNAAKRSVNKAVEKGLVSEATEELVKQVGKDKAKKVVTALGNDVVQNLTTGALYDINKASTAHEVGSDDWWKELGTSAAFNALITGGVAGGSMLTGGKQLVKNAADRGAKVLGRIDAEKAIPPKGIVEFPPRNKSAIDVINPDLAKRGKTVEIGATDEGIDVINPNLESRKPRPEAEPKAEPPKREPMAEEVKAEPPKKKLTAEEKRELMLNRADEKADAIRAELGVESPEPVSDRIGKPKDASKEYTVQLKRENGKKQKVKVEAKSETEALDKAIGRKKGVKNASIVDSAEANPKVEPPTAKARAAGKETKNINLDETVGKKRERKTFREQFHDFTSSAKTKISDSLNAFEEANKQYIKTDHQKWLENAGAIDKTRRSGAIAGRSIGEAQVKWNGDVFEDGKSLKSIYDGMDEATEKDFDKYLLLKHAPDRIREGKPIFAGTQYDSAEACEKAAKELLDKHPEFAERAEDLYRYTRNELQNRVDAGLIKQEVVDEWRKKYPNYVPTGRDGDFGGEHDIWDLAAQLKNNGNTVGAGEIKKAKGGDQPIRSIKEQLADATSRNWRDMSMNNLFRKMFGDKVADELATSADGGLEKVLDNTISLSKTKDGGKYFAEVFEDGEMKRVNIDKRFYDAIEDLYKNGRFGNGIDVMTDAASKVAYPFKNLVTSWNPIFMVKNGMRDFPEAVINSRQTKEFLQIMAQGDAMRELKNGGEFLQAFRNSGVSQANFVNLEEALTKGDNWLKKGVNKFATLQEMVETYPRLIEYMATIKRAGYDLKNGIKDVPMEIRDIAAANAADVTVNFGRSGSVGKMLNRGLVPFFNPSVQGWSKFLRNYSEQSGVKSTLGLILKAAAIGTGATALNNFLLEDNPNYQQISARDKATNYIIPLTWGKDVNADNTTLFIKIPKSRFAAAYSLPAVNTNNENKMGWAEMIKVAGDQVAPVDPSESHILAPLLDATKSKEGETWYGTPIVPQALVDLPKSEQYDVNTSWFGKTLGKATAGLPEELQISPKKADYIIDAETGVIGDFLLPASTPSKQGSGNWAERHITHPMGNVVKKSFTIDSTTQNNLSTRFYDQLDKANTKNQSSKAGEAESDEYKRLNSYSTEISGINKAIRALQGSKRETKVEDVRGLQEFRNQLMQDAIDGKGMPNSSKTLNTVQKYAGTTYAINNFGSSADKKAMKLYGMAKYGDISKQDMRKAINDDKDFFKGVKSISALDAKMEKAGIKSNTTLSKAVALASSDSNDELFGAYEATKKSRTETDNKMNRARTYFKDGGSEDEYVKLETARKTMGKLTDFDESAEIEKAEKQLAKGEISLAEYHAKEDSIKYNANISYIGLATSLAQANAPERGYRLYDIKDKNIQKGINLAAMGFTARDYRRMAKELDTDGNGYPSSKEIRAYVANSDVRDKATLYDALYYYKGKYNPFGTPTNYTRAQAAAIGNSNGIKSISDDTDDFDLKAESGSGGYYRRGYRRGWRHYGRGGGGSKKAPAIKQSNFKAGKTTYTDLAKTLKTASSSKSATTKTASTVKIQPPNVKFKKYEV